MMTALKERGELESVQSAFLVVMLSWESPLAGMPYFVNEYVRNRAVPIPDLLRAFGINLVRNIRP